MCICRDCEYTQASHVIFSMSLSLRQVRCIQQDCTIALACTYTLAFHLLVFSISLSLRQIMCICQDCEYLLNVLIAETGYVYMLRLQIYPSLTSSSQYPYHRDKLCVYDKIAQLPLHAHIPWHFIFSISLSISHYLYVICVCDETRQHYAESVLILYAY